MQQLPMFGVPRVNTDWHPEPPPSLDGVDEITLDAETDGLRWWAGARAVGWAIKYGDRKQYLPFRHLGGGNLPEEQVLEWQRRELRGKRIRNLGINFDAHVALNDGIDWEAQGCTVSNVGHSAALLDEYRHRYNLEDLSQEYLKRGKLQGLDKSRIAGYHAGDVADYACEDVALASDLDDKLNPLLEAEGMLGIKALEDSVIVPTVMMERAGSPLDQEKLERWCRESEHIVQRLLWELTREVGFQVHPTSAGIAKVFDKLGIENPFRTAKLQESYTDAVLEHFQLQHPVVLKLRLVREYISLRVKFLLNYRDQLRKFGRLLYGLHQMGSDEGGTVSGRYSSSAFNKNKEGVNVQQVTKPSKMKLKKTLALIASLYPDITKFTLAPIKNFVIRELFVPESGLYLTTDAKQIQYRLFAHFAKAKWILDAYAKDQNTDFHNLVWEMVREVKDDITRDRTKDLNFAKLFYAGLPKIAMMLGFRRPMAARDDPEGLAETKPFVDAYDRRFPEAKQLNLEAMGKAEERGWVKTILGRRAHFDRGEFTYRALNRIIQGSEADIAKLKIAELHRERKTTGFLMRIMNHDEFCGDIPDLESANRVSEILDRQSVPLRVHILWDTKTGPNWREAT